MSFDVMPLPPARAADALGKDKSDLAVSMGLSHSTMIRSEVLLEDRLVCVTREGHPAAGAPTDLGVSLFQSHLGVSISPTGLRFVDHVLPRDGRKRRPRRPPTGSSPRTS